MGVNKQPKWVIVELSESDAVTLKLLPFPFAGVLQLLRPLLLDVVPTIQQTAALALGRLANYNDDLAEAVVKGDILPQLVYSLAEQNVSCAVLLDNLHMQHCYIAFEAVSLKLY